MLKFGSSLIWRLGTRSTLRNMSGPSATMLKTEKMDAKKITDKIPLDSTKDSKERKLVSAAFASLKEEHTPDDKKPSPKSAKISRAQLIDMKIANAEDVNSLLVLAEDSVVSRRHALKMVSILSEWSNNKKTQISEFEKDPRFLKLCRILARTPTAQALSSMTMAEDLSTVLGITGDDEAARLITNLTLPQMVKVMQALHHKGRRSTPLLRALSHNISRRAETVDLKKAADLLFCMASLNFPDPLLLDRICKDVIDCLPSNTSKPAVVNSIIVSLGLMKYRHEGALTAICEWLQSNSDVCRAHDISSTFVTLATVDFVPQGIDTLLKTAVQLKEEDLTKPSAWLDLVFALLILNKADQSHLESTLRPEFIEKLLTVGEIPIPSRRKLMTIDAYASLKSSSKAPRLPECISVDIPILYTKEKMLYVQSIMDTFKTLVSADAFLKRECNSGMGFLYDAEFAVDAKCHPVPLEKAANDKSVYRIAVMGLDYHDMTRKVTHPLGIFKLHSKLLELKGYKVLQVPYTEYNPKDKLVTRVQYIEKKLKELVKST